MHRAVKMYGSYEEYLKSRHMPKLARCLHAMPCLHNNYYVLLMMIIEPDNKLCAFTVKAKTYG